jgi:hypothetical protein
MPFRSVDGDIGKWGFFDLCIAKTQKGREIPKDCPAH